MNKKLMEKQLMEDLARIEDFTNCGKEYDLPKDVVEKETIEEEKEEENPCQEGYEMVGTKMKDGKEVPNCVPINEAKAIREYIDTELNLGREE